MDFSVGFRIISYRFINSISLSHNYGFKVDDNVMYDQPNHLVGSYPSLSTIINYDSELQMWHLKVSTVVVIIFAQYSVLTILLYTYTTGI